MTLVEAAVVFFPHGPLTISSLRRAASAGTLEIAKVAGKDLTTPRAIRKLVKPSCLAVKPSRHDSGSEKTKDAGLSSIGQMQRGLRLISEMLRDQAVSRAHHIRPRALRRPSASSDCSHP
jgi:hypothetical protein